MSESDWGSDVTELAAPPRKRIPGWVWGCGAGCGLFVIVAALALVFVFRFVREATDQDANWEQVKAVLPFDQRPAGITVVHFPIQAENTSMWVLTDMSTGRQGVLFHAPATPDSRRTRSELLDPTQEVSLGGFGRIDPQPGQVEVQGRTLPCLRYRQMEDDGGGGFLARLKQVMQGSSLVVDLAPEGSDDLLALILTKSGTSEPVSDAELRSFLAPFHIPGGTPREAPEPPGAEAPLEEDR